MTFRLFRRLNEPFPSRMSVSQDLLTMSWAGLFVALFLFWFQPFGLRWLEEGLFLLCVGFGLVTLVCGLSFKAFCHYVLGINTDVPSWTLWKWILQALVMVGTIAVGNYLLLIWVFPRQFDSWRHFFGMLETTLAVGSIPVVIAGLLVQLRWLKKNQQQAAEIAAIDHSATPSLRLSFKLGKNKEFSLDTRDLLYVEAMQNYVVLHYLREGLPQTQVIRSTIVNVIKQVSGTAILRCHRSYLVNAENVNTVSGNAQGLKLSIRGEEGVEIPVSRTYIEAFKNAMKPSKTVN